MAQFDPLIIFPLIWSLTLILVVYYCLSIEILIPQFTGIGKFRKKKLNYFSFFNFFNTSLISKINNTVIFRGGYNSVLVEYMFCKYKVIGSSPISSI